MVIDGKKIYGYADTYSSFDGRLNFEFRTTSRKIAWHDRCEFPDRACTGPLRVPP